MKHPGRVRFKVEFSLDTKIFQYGSRDSKNSWVTQTAQTKVRLNVVEARTRVRHLLGLMSDFSSGVNIRFCDIEEMRSANSFYRGKDYPTDVLSFPATPGTLYDSDMGAPAHPIYALGDILICIPVCHWQARKGRRTLAHEIEKMIVHALVHLKGFDHERGDAAWTVMSNLEKTLSKALITELGQPEWIVET